MKVCAVTMVYRDYWALAQWIRHYSKHVGIANLYVVVHGPDPKVNIIAQGANIWTIPRDTLAGFDKKRSDMLNHFQAGLLQSYDWVIRTDADELICVDPGLYGSFQDLFEKQTFDALFSIGLNVYEGVDDSPLPDGASVFIARSSAVVTGSYSKAWAVSDTVPLLRHGIKQSKARGGKFTYAFPKGVFMAHLKFASIAALSEVNQTRTDVAKAGVPGVPGWGWRNADRHASKFFDNAVKLDVTPWAEACALAYETIPTGMISDGNDGVVRAPSIPFLCCTTLPKWFETC
jgi:hypothetical protein